MRYFTILLLAAIITATNSCRKSAESKGIPTCINTTIETNKNNAAWEYGSVDEYSFQGTKVYVFAPDTRIIADGAIMVQTADCNNLCFIGGTREPFFALCNGDPFYDKAVLLRNIWQKK